MLSVSPSLQRKTPISMDRSNTSRKRSYEFVTLGDDNGCPATKRAKIDPDEPSNRMTSMNRNIRHIREELTHMKKKKEELESGRDALDSMAMFLATKREFGATMDEMANDYERRRQIVSVTKETKATLKQDTNHVVEKLRQVNKDMGHAVENLRELNKDKRRVFEEVKEMNNAIRRVYKELSPMTPYMCVDHINELKEARRRVNQELADTEREESQRKENVDPESARKKELKATIDAMPDAKEIDLKKSPKDINMEIDGLLEKNNDTFKEKAANMEREESQRKENVDPESARKNELKATIDGVPDTKEIDLKKSPKDINKEIDGLLENNNNAFKEKAANMEREESQRKENVDPESARKDELKATINATPDAKTIDLEKSPKSINKEIDGLLEKNNDTFKEKADMLKKELNKNHDDLTNFGKQLKQLRKEIEESKNEVEEFKKSWYKSKKVKKSCAKSISGRRGILAKSTGKKLSEESMKEIDADLNKYKAEIAVVKEEVETKERAKMKEIDADLNKFKADIAIVKEEVETKERARRSKTEAELQSLKAIVTPKVASMNTIDADLRVLQAEINDFKKDLKMSES